jgi:hypothetical protein
MIEREEDLRKRLEELRNRLVQKEKLIRQLFVDIDILKTNAKMYVCFNVECKNRG